MRPIAALLAPLCVLTALAGDGKPEIVWHTLPHTLDDEGLETAGPPLRLDFERGLKPPQIAALRGAKRRLARVDIRDGDADVRALRAAHPDCVVVVHGRK